MKDLWDWFWFEKEDEAIIINKKFRMKTFRFLFFNLLALNNYLLYDFSHLTRESEFYISKIPFLFENNPIYPLIISGEIITKQLSDFVCFFSIACAFGFSYRISCFFTALFFNILYFGSCLDEFQHHYLLCLLLWILIFLEEYHESEYLWISRLISVQLSIVYFFTIITKISDNNFLFIKGKFSPIFLGKLWVHETITWISNIFNLKEETIWILSSVFVISIELFLSISIIINTRTNNYKIYKFFTFIIGLSLHISFETVASLRIGFFSVYMIFLYWLLLGPTFFIPKNIINKIV